MFNIKLLTSFLSGSILFESYWQVIFRLICSFVLVGRFSFVKLHRGLHRVMHGDRYLDMVW